MEEDVPDLMHMGTPMPKIFKKQYSSSDSLGFREDPFGLLIHKKQDVLDKNQFLEMKLNKDRARIPFQDDLKPMPKLKLNLSNHQSEQNKFTDRLKLTN